MFLSEYKAVGLHVSMFQNNIKMDIKNISAYDCADCT